MSIFILQGKRIAFECGDRDQKTRIISSLPTNWSIRRIQREFPTASNTFIQKAKTLQQENGR